MTKTSGVKAVEQANAVNDEKMVPVLRPSPFHSTSNLQPYTIMSWDNYEQWVTSTLTRMKDIRNDREKEDILAKIQAMDSVSAPAKGYTAATAVANNLET
ncbi:hypothetical protein M9H77_06594 [Catharanthus roseus]|uniref:Uncharacterized protein n=1 Tax=Catharanthus roseus TaxID=4058 RepID=A0ACC0BSS2_CATRO|nr:hypothetical protein M9H77_06594 [Catharanthus roseus]